jgi:Carboxypeptidase regulatory-like domain/TonB-dependent Receptor Plug Domain
LIAERRETMRRPASLLLVAALVSVMGTSIRADVQTTGKISGVVQAEDGSPLPGATVTLTGEQLIARSLTDTTNNNGIFRFLNLQPGQYTVTIALPGFVSQEIGATVRLGQTTSIETKMPLVRAQEQVTVRGEAPLIDKTSPKLSTNYTAEKLQELPIPRNYFEAIDTAPGINDRAAFGAGGNVEGYDAFGFGAATNLYNINGVSVSNLQFGNTWVNPNYDTIDEVQVVGPGASAEYANYTGAFINVVTKKGTNAFHGGLSVWYTDDSLVSDNARGIVDLEPNVTNNNIEASVNAGGPIVKEKLHFFGSAGFFHSENAAPGSPLFDDLKRQTYQLRLDFMANTSNTLSAMYNLEPIRDEDLGLQIGSGREIGYLRDWQSDTYTASWQTVLSKSTYGELRYAGLKGHNDRIPNASLDISGVNDLRTGRQYNSTGFQRQQETTRSHILGSVTHYVDSFLKGSHELKAGVEYEDALAEQRLRSGGNALFYIFPYSADTVLIYGITGYNYHVKNRLKRLGTYVQDNYTVGRATINLGLRYDNPKTKDERAGKTLLDFDNWSPRLGVSYDVSGDGKTVLHGAWGQYYEKVPTYGPATYAGTGLDPVSYYIAFAPSAGIDPTNWQGLHDLVLQPANFAFDFTTTAIPVDPNIGNPRVDVFNAGIERQIGRRLAVSLSYVHRKATDFIVLGALNDVAFTPLVFTNPLTNEPQTIYSRVDPSIPIDFFLTNNNRFEKQRTDLVILELRGNPIDKLSLSGSVQWENTRGTRDNNECAVLSLCTNGRYKNPNYEQNPFTDGHLPMEREWVFKLNGGYELPWRVHFNFDYRYLGGRPWGAVTDCFRIPGCNDPYLREVQLEPKDARRQGKSNLLNLRVGKDFEIGPVTATALVDVLNVFNDDASNATFFNSNINDFYSFESAERGEIVPAFGKPAEIQRPRETRVGLRVVF